MKKLNLLLLLLFSVISLNINAHNFSASNNGKTIYYNITSSTDLTVSVTYQGNSYNSYYNEYEGAITIPSSVTYNGKTYSVTSIGDYAFYDCGRLTSVTIGNSVTSIGDYAFYGCSVLTSVTMGNSVTSIGENAFFYCIRLTSITIPNSVTTIGYNAFDDCIGLTRVYINDLAAWCNIDFGNSSANPLYYAKKLYLNNELVTDLIIPNSVTSIGDYAFYGCSGLTSIDIPNSVTTIGGSAFDGCSGLTSVTIPNSVTSIGNYAFSDCSGLKELTMEDGEGTLSLGISIFNNCPLETLYLGKNLSYGYDSPFKNKTTLKTLTIGNSVTSIVNFAFYDCSGLTSVTIGNSVTSIGDAAFDGCSGLTSVTMGNSVTEIGGSAFYGCSKLTSVTIPNSVTSIGYQAFYNCKGLTSVTIGNSVTTIGGSAFDGCSGLTSVTMGNSVTEIGGSAFAGCSGLTSIDIPNSVTSIGSRAFYGCSKLTSVTIPNSVTSISDYAFYGCSGLTSITIPHSVAEIGENALSNLKRIYIPTGYELTDSSNKYIRYDISEINSDGVELIYKKTSNTDVSLIAIEHVRSKLEIPSSITSNGITHQVTSIGNSAFYGCSGLTSINIPNRVALIGDSAFYGCSGLTSINIPESVTSIGKYTFANCSGLSSITIPNSVTTICDYAFHNCDLSTVVLGKRVASIGKYAFSGVGSYSKVEWPSTYVIYSLNVNPPSVERNTFYEGSYYANLIVPVVEKYHGSDWKEELGFVVPEGYGYSRGIYSLTCFENDGIEYSYIGGGRVIVSGADKSITKVNIPNSIANNSSNYDVVGIGDSAFIDCGHLKSVIIPNSVTSIGYSAFYNCDSLTTVLIPNGVETIGENAFSECDMLSHVKIGKNVSYISANPFVNCPKLTTIDIASDNKYLSFENATLYGNNKTEIISLINYNESSYTIAENIRIIYPKAFEGCPSLTTLNYNAVNCVRIGNSNNYVYGDNPTITTINIASNVESIPEFAFDGCTSLTTLNYNAVNCVKMGSSMNPVFGDNPTLTKINIASDVVNIPGYAFKNCPISTITIPDKVTKIGDGVFYNCTLLKEIYSRKSAPAPYIQGGGTFTGVSKTIPIYVPEGSKSSYSSQYGWNEFTNIREVYDKSVSIDGVKYGIDKENIAVVYGANIDIVNVDIKDVVVYEGVEYPVKKISTTAFYMTKDIETITIGNNIDVIPEGAFKNMTNLKKIVIGKNVTTIGDHAFYNCTNIQEIYSKKAGTAPYILGAGTFVGVSKTIPLYIPEGSYSSYSTQYGWSDFTNKKEVYEKTVFINGITYGLSKEGVAVVVDVHKDVKKAEIENMVEIDGDEYPVTTIIEGSFAFAKKIITLIIGNNITSIPNRAFENSYSLKLVIIGENVTSIGDYAFYNCNGIKEINSGKAGTAPYILGGSTFAGVNKTIPIYVPEGSHSAYIKQYGWSDFSNFKVANYKTIEIEGIKYRVSEDDTYAYVEKVNTSITDANIKDYITIYDNQYPVTEINSEMFTLCSNLSSAIIPSYMEKIGEQAFYACYNVKEIYSLNSTPPMCDMYAFYGVDVSIPVYIPYGSKAAYQAADEWKDFTCFIESEFTGVEEEEISTSDIKVISGNGVEINDYYGRIRIVNLAGQVIKDAYVNGSIQISLPKGIYIVVTENSSQKVIL